MPKVVIKFHLWEVKEQVIHTLDDLLDSHVYFDLVVDGREHSDLVVHVKQPVGGSASSAYEVQSIGLNIPFGYGQFRRAVEDYCRERFQSWFVVQDERPFTISAGRFRTEKTVEFDADGPGGPSGGW